MLLNDLFACSALGQMRYMTNYTPNMKKASVQWINKAEFVMCDDEDILVNGIYRLISPKYMYATRDYSDLMLRKICVSGYDGEIEEVVLFSRKQARKGQKMNKK